MTTQYAVLPARSGRSYTAKLFTVADPDTEVTGNTITVTERTNAKGMFRAGIARASALPAGDYILVYLYGTIGAAIGYFTFAGTDGETATTTPETAALDSAIQTQVNNIENASGYLLAVLAGACADPQTASETYAITVFGSTFTVDMAGQTSTGVRTAPTLTKS